MFTARVYGIRRVCCLTGLSWSLTMSELLRQVAIGSGQWDRKIRGSSCCAQSGGHWYTLGGLGDSHFLHVTFTGCKDLRNLRRTQAEKAYQGDFRSFWLQLEGACQKEREKRNMSSPAANEDEMFEMLKLLAKNLGRMQVERRACTWMHLFPFVLKSILTSVSRFRRFTPATTSKQWARTNEHLRFSQMILFAGERHII